jgi:RNA-binding protein Nova
MRSLGYSDSANAEVCAALGILAKYGVLGVGVGLSNGNHQQTSTNPLSYLSVSALDQQQSQQLSNTAATKKFPRTLRGDI